MKIKRTKTGNSKHEIVKSEQNGNLNSDESVPLINCKKQSNLIGVPASPSSAKRGNNSHRKDKVKSCSSQNFDGTANVILIEGERKSSDKGKT